MRVDQPVHPFCLSGRDYHVERTCHHLAARPVEQDCILYMSEINLAWMAVKVYWRLAAAEIPPISGQFVMELEE